MTNSLAYLIAIISVYRKQLLILLTVVAAGGFTLYTPVEKKILDEIPKPLSQRSRETYQPYAAGADQPGRRYVSLEELKAAERESGYLPIGYFGDSWPAVVSEVLNDRDSIEFVLQNGIMHRYSGFDGYDLRAVRMLSSGNRETFIVFRSEQKR